MISLDTGLLGDNPHGNTIQRHIEYANRIGDLSIVVYNPASQRQTTRRHSDRLVVYPTNARTPYLFPIAGYRVATRAHRLKNADLITTQDPFATGLIGVLLKWRFGLPLNVQSHSAFFENPDWLREHPYRNKILYKLGRFVVQQADTNRVLTQRDKKIYIGLGVPNDRITVLNTPTHVENFAVPVPTAELVALRAALGISPDAPVLLWVGFPAEFKHIDLLREAYRLVQNAQPDVRLVMVGDFSTHPQFIQQAKAAGVIFTGRISHDDLPPYYQMANLYVHSSRYEGVPKVLIEALASGTPVVSTDHLGADTVVRDGETGLLTAHTPEGLCTAILELLADPIRIKIMGEAGREDVLERFNYERQLEAVVETFRETMRTRRW
jgi:glycosyltransferase involved in cell wall biosynthesis